MNTLPFLPQHFKEISEHLNKGLPIILPTETSYGFSGNIFSHTAIHAIERIKKRENKAFIVLTESFQNMKTLGDISHISTENISDIQKNSDAFTVHAPTTFVLPKNINHMPQLQNYFPNFKNIAIRVPQYTPLIGFLQSHKTPIFSTSANFPGQNPIYTSLEIEKHFGNISNLLFVDAGDLEKNPPSSIVQFTENGERIVLRN